MKNNISFSLSTDLVIKVKKFLSTYVVWIIGVILIIVSITHFIHFYFNGYGLAYNDARSHLDIGRRVVEGLKPGLAQLGSVWLPLPHILMVPTIWNDFMWHTGLSGGLQSMISFVVTGIFIYLFLKKLHIGMWGRFIAVFVFASNLNILYLQSTAMTELLLLATMTAGVYYLLLWQQEDKILHLMKAAFWIMLSTLNRYDGWFLFAFAILLIGIVTIKKGFKKTEGTIFLFCTLAGLGIVLWFLWNLLIFKDPLYFAFGPYSAHSQQQQLEHAGVLATKRDFWLSLKVYFYALVFTSGLFFVILGGIGAGVLFWDRNIKPHIKIILSALFAPFIFNVIALYLGHSVLFVQGISGDTWFNIRYGVMMMPSIAIFIGYLIDRSKKIGYILIIFILLVTGIALENQDATTIDDARVGSSQKNVTEVSSWLAKNANKPGFVLISAASHDAIIFSSGLPMSRFIHEGTGGYWDSATTSPDRWARWIIMRTNDVNDQTFRLVSKSPGFSRYTLMGHYPFADIYELKTEYLSDLNYKPVLGKQK